MIAFLAVRTSGEGFVSQKRSKLIYLVDTPKSPILFAFGSREARKETILKLKEMEYGLKRPENPCAKIWRYIETRHLIEMLETQTLYFAPLAKVSDKEEGKTPESIRELYKVAISAILQHQGLEHSIDNYMKNLEDSRDKMKSEVFLCCWHLDEDESLGRWNYYSGRDIAIQSTYLDLELASWNNGKNFRVSLVDYIIHKDNDVSKRHPLTECLQKDLSLECEKELRAIRHYPPESGKEGACIPVNLELLLGRIVISPTARASMRAAVRTILQQLGLNIKVNDSKFRPVTRETTTREDGQKTF